MFQLNQKAWFKWMVGGLPLLAAMGWSATSCAAVAPQDLTHVTGKLLQTAMQDPHLSFIELNRATDFNHTLHVRFQEQYDGHAINGADGVLHISQATNVHAPLSALMQSAPATLSMNGTVYLNLSHDLTHDLAQAPHDALNATGGDAATQAAFNAYRDQYGTAPNASAVKNALIVYIDQNNKAHWAYQVKFDVLPANVDVLPKKPIYIIDALTKEVYAHWDNLQTSSDISGGGYGGNQKMGKLVYDGVNGDLPSLQMTRGSMGFMCSLSNKLTVVKHATTKAVENFKCGQADPQHGSVYWDADKDHANGGYSPGNDALFDGAVITNMYQSWYHIPALVNPDGSVMTLMMFVHAKMDNAYWDGSEMMFGDGISMFYPLTSIDVGAHEISHGFTEQHSGLDYAAQSGGINESFSDMAAQAGEYFAYGKNDWQIGATITKDNSALRYMDQPSKDCAGGKPGDSCSIDDASEYHTGLDVHYSSGVYNRLFYLIATTPGWDTRKAFDVMVQANRFYWTASATYKTAACGVLKATQDYKYDVDAVKTALTTVKVDYSKCA